MVHAKNYETMSKFGKVMPEYIHNTGKVR